jgi:transcriptional regulator with XRE-family HTH domain
MPNTWRDKTAFYLKLGERLPVAWKTLGISEGEAADAAGVTITTYRKWEKGEHVVSCDPLLNLCDEFHVSVDWIISGKGKFLAETEEERQERWRKRFSKGILTDGGQPFGTLTKH